jgi:AraC-like DNA-binding protein
MRAASGASESGARFERLVLRYDRHAMDRSERLFGELLRLRAPSLQLLELAAPWGARIESCDRPGMYVVHRGAARVDVHGTSVLLEQGSFVLLPRGGGSHLVRDALGGRPLSARELASREERSESVVRLHGPGPRARISAIPFAAAQPFHWLPAVVSVRPMDVDSVGRALLEAYEQALERGEPEVLERVAEALWIRTIAQRLPRITHLDIEVLRVAASVIDDPTLPHTLASLARTAGLSRSRFSARFAAAFGEPPVRWVQRARMGHADRLLQEGRLTIAAIAERLGFNDESAFRKAYRRLMGHPARRSPTNVE